MNLEIRISAFSSLGEILKAFLSGDSHNEFFDYLSEVFSKAKAANPWFTDDSLVIAIDSIANNLDKNSLYKFVEAYDFPEKKKRVAVIMAGNLPLVGFHDFLSVLLSGHIFIGKLSSKDEVLLTAIINILIKIEPHFSSQIIIEKELISNFDAVIATGSNNSGRYFDYYFGKYPSIIRRNRNSVALINPEDDEEVFKELGKDMLYYFGLGCRSVSKLMVPKGFDFVKFLDALETYKYVADNFKYFNNYEYNKSIFLINRVAHLDTGFLLLREDASLTSPISVMHYEYYEDKEIAEKQIALQLQKIQCVVSSKPLEFDTVLPGQTQFPSLSDWSDGVDVLDFLSKL